MATRNIWQQFKALIPEGARVAATITVNNGNGTSQAMLRDGSVITVKGGGCKCGAEGVYSGWGDNKSAAPNLAQYEVEV